VSHWGTKGPAALYLEERTNSQRVKTKCCLCRRQFTGRADEGREWAKTHRARVHPELLKVKRRRPGKYQRKVAA
jgi:hypothetical protein